MTIENHEFQATCERSLIWLKLDARELFLRVAKLAERWTDNGAILAACEDQDFYFLASALLNRRGSVQNAIRLACERRAEIGSPAETISEMIGEVRAQTTRGRGFAETTAQEAFLFGIPAQSAIASAIGAEQGIPCFDFDESLFEYEISRAAVAALPKSDLAEEFTSALVKRFIALWIDGSISIDAFDAFGEYLPFKGLDPRVVKNALLDFNHARSGEVNTVKWQENVTHMEYETLSRVIRDAGDTGDEYLGDATIYEMWSNYWVEVEVLCSQDTELYDLPSGKLLSDMMADDCLLHETIADRYEHERYEAEQDDLATTIDIVGHDIFTHLPLYWDCIPVEILLAALRAQYVYADYIDADHGGWVVGAIGSDVERITRSRIVGEYHLEIPRWIRANVYDSDERAEYFDYWSS